MITNSPGASLLGVCSLIDCLTIRLPDHLTILNYNTRMHRCKLIPILLIGFVLAACSSPAVETPVPTHTVPAGMLPTDLPPTPNLPTLPPTETPSLTQPLDGQTTFAVIAAVQGNLATIELWLAQGLSVFERRAVVAPLAETSIAPLGDILEDFTPQPALAEYWAQAADLQAQFYPALQSWITGDVDDDAFAETLEGIAAQGEGMIAAAGEIARTQLSVDTSRYGPDYTIANDIVYELSPLIGGTSASGQSAAALESPDLVVKTLVPFTHTFAGTDIFTVIGVLENTGDTPLTNVEIKISFFDEDDNLLGVTTGVLSASTALPGRTYPFNASTITQGEEKDLLKWTSYQTSILAQADTTSPYQDFTLTADSAGQNSLGEIEISGTLTNTGSQTVPAGMVFIGAAAYDAAGNLVGVGAGSAGLLAELPPGASAPFEANISAKSGDPVSYQFFAEASD